MKLKKHFACFDTRTQIIVTCCV